MIKEDEKSKRSCRRDESVLQLVVKELADSMKKNERGTVGRGKQANIGGKIKKWMGQTGYVSNRENQGDVSLCLCKEQVKG